MPEANDVIPSHESKWELLVGSKLFVPIEMQEPEPEIPWPGQQAIMVVRILKTKGMVPPRMVGKLVVAVYNSPDNIYESALFIRDPEDQNTYTVLRSSVQLLCVALSGRVKMGANMSSTNYDPKTILDFPPPDEIVVQGIRRITPRNTPPSDNTTGEGNDGDT
jgi:hypothetical protein